MCLAVTHAGSTGNTSAYISKQWTCDTEHWTPRFIGLWPTWTALPNPTLFTIHTVIHSFALPVNTILKRDPHHVLGTLLVFLVWRILASFIFLNTCLNDLFGDFHLLTRSAILKSCKLSKQKSYFGHRGFCFATSYIWIGLVSSHWGAYMRHFHSDQAIVLIISEIQTLNS